MNNGSKLFINDLVKTNVEPPKIADKEEQIHPKIKN